LLAKETFARKFDCPGTGRSDQMKEKTMNRRHHNFALAMKATTLACLAALVVAPLAWSQSIETGAIVGTAVDEQGAAMPGVTIALRSPDKGTTATIVTDGAGRFRFLSILPGTYTVEASLDGFKIARQSDVVLTVTKTLTVDFIMQVGAFEEVIEVRGAPLIDTRESSLATMEIPNQILMDVPTPRDLRSVVSLGQGVSSDPDGERYSAYGSSIQGIQYSVDGVITNSPEAGETEYEMDFDNLQEVSILGVGAPAEYDGFSGVIVNAVTKSGTNEIHGMGSIYYQDSEWTSSNTSNPDLERGGAKETAWDVPLNIGGPLIKDKLFFFAALKFNNAESPGDPGMGVDFTNEGKRLLGKINWLPSQEQSLTSFLEYSTRDTLNIGADDSAFFTPGTTFDNVQTQWGWNVNYTNVLTDTALLEAKFGGYIQEQDELPQNGDTPARYDEYYDQVFDNWFGPFTADRERYLLAASVSKFVDNFGGSHDFKFGAEFERTPVHTMYGLSGDRYYISTEDEPYLRYDTFGYDTFAETDRISGYIQDSWSINPSLTINAGIRVNYWRGSVGANVNEEYTDMGTIFKPEVGIAPRIGFTYELPTKKTAVIKGHWGRFYHQVIALYYSRMAPESDLSLYVWDPDEEEWIHEFTEVRDSSQFSLDDNLNMPYMDAVALGFEKAISSLVSIDITGTWRKNHDFLDKVNLTGEFEEVEYYDEFTDSTYDVYNQLNPGDNQFLITNPGNCADYGQAYDPITCFKKERDYWGITASFNRRFANNWQLQGSYTYGEASGNDDNLILEFGEGRSSSLGGSAFYTNPNSQINATGNLTIDPTHQVKLVGSVHLPLKFIVGGFFWYSSGNTYNQVIPIYDVDPPDTNIYGQPRGTFRMDSGFNLDLRLEKLFSLGAGTDLSFGVNIFNVTNESTQVAVEENVDSEDAFGDTIDIVRPRRYQLVLRFTF
jgi:hypothetical protein